MAESIIPNTLNEQIVSLSTKVTVLKHGWADTGTFTQGTAGGQTGYYQDVTNPLPGQSIKYVFVSLYNYSTASLGFMNGVPFVSNISANGFRIWSPIKANGYHMYYLVVY